MGGTITPDTLFSEYANAIRTIPQGGTVPETSFNAQDLRTGKTAVANQDGSAVQITGTMPNASFATATSNGYDVIASTAGYVSAGTITHLPKTTATLTGATFKVASAGYIAATTKTVPPAVYTEDSSSAYIGIGYNGTARTISKGGGATTINDYFGLYAGTISADVGQNGNVGLHGSACLVANTVAGYVHLYESGQPNDSSGTEPVVAGNPILVGSDGQPVTIGGSMLIVGNSGAMSSGPVLSDCVIESGASAQGIAYDSSGQATYLDHPVGGTMTVLDGGVVTDCYGQPTINSGGSVIISSGSNVNTFTNSGETRLYYCSGCYSTVTGGYLTTEYCSDHSLDLQEGTVSGTYNNFYSINQSGGELYCELNELQNASSTNLQGGTVYLGGSATEYSGSTVIASNTVVISGTMDCSNMLNVNGGTIILTEYSSCSNFTLQYGSANIGSNAVLEGYVNYSIIENTDGGTVSYNCSFYGCTINNGSQGYVYGSATADSSYINGGHFDGQVNGGSVFVSSASVDAQVSSGYLELRNCSNSYGAQLYGGTMTLAEYTSATIQIQTYSNPFLYVSAGCTATIRNNEWEVSQYVYVEDGGVVIYQPY